MKIQQSRNQREGHYAGVWTGNHRRTKNVSWMIGVSASKWERHLEDSKRRAYELMALLNEGQP